MTVSSDFVTAYPLPPHTWREFPHGVRVAIRKGAPKFQRIAHEDPVDRMREAFRIAGTAIVGWSGVLDDRTHELAPVTPKTTSDLMHIPGMVDALIDAVSVDEHP